MLRQYFLLGPRKLYQRRRSKLMRCIFMLYFVCSQHIFTGYSEEFPGTQTDRRAESSDDQKIEIRQVSALFEQERPEDRQAKKLGDIRYARRSRKARARRAI